MGMTGMIQHIWRTEGLAGFFKGFGSSLACHVTYSFLWWACYSTTRRQVAHFFPSLPANHTILYDAVTGILAGGLPRVILLFVAGIFCQLSFTIIAILYAVSDLLSSMTLSNSLVYYPRRRSVRSNQSPTRHDQTSHTNRIWRALRYITHYVLLYMAYILHVLLVYINRTSSHCSL